MEMMIDFPGGARVNAHFGRFTVCTDQPSEAGGDGSAPTPFDIFLASLGTCAGIYVLGFCRERSLPTQGIRLIQRVGINPKTKLADKISLNIQLPLDFPDKYRPAVIRAAGQCKVKKHFEHPPDIEVKTSVAEAVFA
jgi:putative redox protein